MKLDEPQLITLPNGLRLVYIHCTGAASGIFGITVGTGSANEQSGQFGLAHLVEHTIFKGTLRRRPWHIINRMEAVGGELNAFTTKEETTVYTIFPRGNANRAIELIADLAINSQFPAKELDKEREVVIDEINSYRDMPSEAIFDDFEDLVYTGTPLGHNILGSTDSVLRLGSEDCRRFLQKYYTARNSVLFYSGPQSLERTATMAAKHFEGLPAGDVDSTPLSSHFKTANNELPIEGLHQSHTVLGIEVDNIFGLGRYADGLFSNLIGGPGMNSLLNIELRERRGLVYTVESSITRFTTTGLLTVYFGCDPDDTRRCLDLCRSTALRLAETPSAQLEQLLTKAKRQWLGQLAIGSENRENRIMGAARAVLFTGQTVPDNISIERIKAVDAQQIKDRALRLTSPATLTYHPIL